MRPPYVTTVAPRSGTYDEGMPARETFEIGGTQGPITHPDKVVFDEIEEARATAPPATAWTDL